MNWHINLRVLINLEHYLVTLGHIEHPRSRNVVRGKMLRVCVSIEQQTCRNLECYLLHPFFEVSLGLEKVSACFVWSATRCDESC